MKYLGLALAISMILPLNSCGHKSKKAKKKEEKVEEDRCSKLPGAKNEDCKDKPKKPRKKVEKPDPGLSKAELIKQEIDLNRKKFLDNIGEENIEFLNSHAKGLWVIGNDGTGTGGTVSSDCQFYLLVSGSSLEYRRVYVCGDNYGSAIAQVEAGLLSGYGISGDRTIFDFEPFVSSCIGDNGSFKPNMFVHPAEALAVLTELDQFNVNVGELGVENRVNWNKYSRGSAVFGVDTNSCDDIISYPNAFKEKHNYHLNKKACELLTTPIHGLLNATATGCLTVDGMLAAASTYIEE